VPTAPGAHDARVRPPLMAEAEFCAACHKVGLGREITADRWLRGQNDYDAWHTSAVSGNGAGSVYRPAISQRCQDCHMPLEAAPLGDPAAKNGMIRSHRFLGANSALAHLRGDDDQERRTVENLRGRASLTLLWSGPSRVDALLRARGVGHRFPIGRAGPRRYARSRHSPRTNAARRRRRAPARPARPATHARRRLRRGPGAV